MVREVQYQQSSSSKVIDFINRVYALMAMALLVTAATAYYVSTMPQIYMQFKEKPWLLPLIFIGQLALVIALSVMINRISFGTACLLYFAYATSVGFTFSLLFLVYTVGSIFKTFLVTAGMFGAMSLYGFVTKSDLTKIGNIAFMGLIGLIIASLVNLYFQSAQFDYILSGFGVIIFTALTAYDTQKIKELGTQLAVVEKAPMAQVALMGALTLYLDFINLFLFMLRFMGGRREN